MTTWNYRIMQYAGDDGYGIHEVYYNESGVPENCTAEDVGVVGETIEELRASYEMMAEAFRLPVLQYDDFKGETNG